MLAVAGVLLTPGVANATTRYAAPGGTAVDTVCVTPDAPKCSIGTASGGTHVQSADDAVILPGNYSDTAGDLDGDDDGTPGEEHFVQPRAGTIHGQEGGPRPVITLNTDTFYGAFFLCDNTLSDVTITTSASTSDLTTGPGSACASVVDRIIARSSKANAIVCNHIGGTIRNSACLSTGSGAAAVGSSNQNGVAASIDLRGVTAVSTGAGSFGLNYLFAGTGANWTISAKSVIAQGTLQDVVARASSNGVTTLNLDHSDYDAATTETATGGTASVTAAGTNHNIITAPLLDADGIHQLTGSPTINAGATDGSSGTTDIDGQLRQIGSAADIGADEFADAATTTVSCLPNPVSSGAPATCTATVTAAAEPLAGRVAFSSNSAGVFGGGAVCTLAGGAQSKQCQVTYTPSAVSSHQITASYSGDGAHDPTHGSTTLAVNPSQGSQLSGRKKCKKKRRSAGAAKKKCKRKR